MSPKHHASLSYLLSFGYEYVRDLNREKWRDWLKKKRWVEKIPREEIDVQRKVVVITGANAGLGKRTAQEMAKRGAVVVLGCRDLARGKLAQTEIMEETGSKTVELYHLDLTDFSTVRLFAAAVLQNHAVIDILINNGGIAFNTKKQQLTKEGWDLQMTTNHLGHFLLTNLLIDAILPSPISRVVAVGSTGCIPSTLDTDDLMMTQSEGKDKGFCGSQGYQNSKFANALFMKSLAKRYPSLKAFATCPGVVRETEILQNLEMRPLVRILIKPTWSIASVDLKKGVDAILLCSLGKQVETGSGGFWRFGRRLKGVEKMMREDVAEALWNASEKYVGLDFFKETKDCKQFRKERIAVATA